MRYLGGGGAGGFVAYRLGADGFDMDFGHPLQEQEPADGFLDGAPDRKGAVVAQQDGFGFAEGGGDLLAGVEVHYLDLLAFKDFVVLEESGGFLADHPEALDVTLKMINAKDRLLYSSDWPHWDFDAPSVIWNLPMLDEQAKKNVLGENALKLFGLERPDGK